MEPSTSDLYLLGGVVALAVPFAIVELRSTRPFIDLRMLAGNGPLVRTYLRQLLAFLIVYSILFGYVQWLESSRGLSESVAGALLLPMSAVAVISAGFAGRDTGVKIRLIITAAALTTGSIALLLVGTGTPIVALVGLGVVFGVGQGMTSVTNQTTLYLQAPADRIGTASGLFRTAQYLGAIVSATLIALCFGPHASSAGLHRLAWTLTGIGLLLFAVTALDRVHNGRTEVSAAASPR